MNLYYLPYLNSSLFEKQKIEKELLSIENLDDYSKLEYYPKTQIKDQNAKAKSGQVGLLEYIFEFLDAFDFGSDEDEHKELISSSVLGLVFEKLNGYKEGSFYTPSFITAYMSKQSLEKVVVAKFNEAYPKWNALSLQDINEEIKDTIRADRSKKEAYKAEFKKLLEGLKICDPAVGSGHFLVSCLNEMIYIYYELGLLTHIDELSLINDELLIKTKKGEHFRYTKPNSAKDEAQLIQKELFELKKTIIENNLFGVDINDNSCEITKLRLWIELLKNSYYLDFEEEYKSEFKNTHQLATLPNIDINIKCGNSLIYYFETDKSLSHYPNIKERIKRYKRAVKDYKDGFYSDKEAITQEIKALKESFKNFCFQDKFAKEVKNFEKKCQEYSQKYSDYLARDDEKLIFYIPKSIFVFEFDENKAKQEFKELQNEYEKIFNLEANKPFEWRFEFPEILDDEANFTGFDLIIGNPPYIRQEEIKELKPMLAKNYKVYKGTSDIYTYFFELSFKVLKDKGILNFITSNKYARAGYGEALREFLLKNTSLLAYTDLNSVKVFDAATVDTSILSFSKTKPAKDSHFTYLALNNELLEKCKFNISLTQEYMHLEQKSLSKESFSFNDEKTNALKAKIEKIGTPLKEWDISIYRGILTGYNEAFIIDTAKKDEILANCKDEAEKQRTSELIKPILRGRDIKRYSYEWAGLWLINTHNGYTSAVIASEVKQSINSNKEQNSSDIKQMDCHADKSARNDKTIKIPPIDIEQYPALKAHFDKTAQSHKGKGKGFYNRDDKGITPYNLRNCAYLEEFAKEKIVYSEIVRDPRFYLDSGDFKFGSFYAEATSFVLTGEHLEYLLAVLHSKIATYAFKNFYAGGGLGESGYRYKKAFLEKLPIPKINSKQEQNFITMVKELLELKNNPNWGEQDAREKRILELESSLDEMVCELYKLNEAERKYIHTHTHTHTNNSLNPHSKLGK